MATSLEAFSPSCVEQYDDLAQPSSAGATDEHINTRRQVCPGMPIAAVTPEGECAIARSHPRTGMPRRPLPRDTPYRDTTTTYKCPILDWEYHAEEPLWGELVIGGSAAREK